jgi:hypothetical protein
MRRRHCCWPPPQPASAALVLVGFAWMDLGHGRAERAPALLGAAAATPDGLAPPRCSPRWARWSWFGWSRVRTA